MSELCDPGECWKPQLEAERDALRAALNEAVEYLDRNHGLNSIGAGSILHQQMRAAIGGASHQPTAGLSNPEVVQDLINHGVAYMKDGNRIDPSAVRIKPRHADWCAMIAEGATCDCGAAALIGNGPPTPTDALVEAVEYLDGNHGLNSIAAGSILHQKMRAAVGATDQTEMGHYCTGCERYVGAKVKGADALTVHAAWCPAVQQIASPPK